MLPPSPCSVRVLRTAQVCALAQLCLDPYYRTFSGFMVLLQKEWIGFGHCFRERLGHDIRCGCGNWLGNGTGPIFLQFMDLVFQLIVQFPYAFQV